jgi:hypothetical protein
LDFDHPEKIFEIKQRIFRMVLDKVDDPVYTPGHTTQTSADG